MKKRHTFICILACLLLLPCGAQGARVMDVEEIVAAPIGEETPAVAVNESAGGAFVDAMDAASDEITSEGEFARLNDADSLHTAAGDHTGWNGIAATTTLSTDNYYLSGDFTGNLTVAAGETAVLCLNGHTITSATSTTILINEGATLRICDCRGGGCVTGGGLTGGAGVGGGVKVNGGKLELYGGSITGNKATRTGTGGGVCIAANGTFNMYGGSVDHNEAVRGGGVYVSSGSKFVMTGGSITNNTATTLGGGVCILKDDTESSSCRLSGTPVIVGNTANSGPSNVYLYGGGYISIPAALTDTAQVGINVETPGVFAVPRANLPGGDCAAKFTSDSDDYGIGINAAGRLLLDVPVTVTYTIPAGVTGTAPATQECIAGETVTLDTETVLVKDGYGFAGWTNDRNVKKTLTEVVPTEDTVLYPIFYVGFENSGKSTDIDMTYGVDIVNIDLSDFVQSSDGSTDVTFRFTAPGGLPLGLKLVNDAGEEKGVRHIITGRPVATPGDYVAKFTVNQVGEAAVLFDLAQSPSFQSGELTLDLHIAKPSISAADFEFAPPAQLTQSGEVKAATITPRKGVLGGVGAITLRYSPAEPVMAGTYQVFADVAEGTRYQGATNLTDPVWTFTIAEPATPASGVVVGAPQWANGRTTIALTPTPANLLTGARVIAARYDANGAMTDLAWGTLTGNTVAFSGKQLVRNDGWKLFFLNGNSYAPLCAAVPLTSSTP